MSERKPSKGSTKHFGLGLVAMLLLSSMGGLLLVPATSANHTVSGSLGITASLSPTPDMWYQNMDVITFTAEVTNFYTTPSGGARTLNWYACAGNIAANLCKSTYTDTGTFLVPNIDNGNPENLTSSATWSPNGASGIHTIVYGFSHNDQNASDDAYVFNINLTEHFVDISLDAAHDPLEHLQNLAEYDGDTVLNTGTAYTFKAKGTSYICGNPCTLAAEFGWQLWDLAETVKLKEGYRTLSMTGWGGIDPLNVNLPNLTFEQEGRFLLKYGLFGSTGNPNPDLNAHNNLASFELVFNDSLDLKINDVYPSHDRTSSQFYFGTDRVVVEISNDGNMTVDGTTLNFEVYDQQYELEVQDACEIPTMYPGSVTTCSLNLTTTGASRLFRAQLPTVFAEGEDVRMGDNLYSVTADVVIGPIQPNIQINSQTKVFLSSDDVELVGRFSPIASQPLNYTWREGFYTWGHGQVLNVTGEEFGLGPHNVSLQVQDPWGNTEYAYIEFDVLNAINITNEPYFRGSVTSDQEATFTHDIVLPTLGASYSIGQGKSPLLLIDLNVEGINGAENGLRSIELDLNLTALLPESIDFTTVDLRYLPSTDTQLWSYIEGVDTFEFNPTGDRVSVSLTKDGVILLIGVLPPTDVKAIEFDWSQRKGGQIQLDWSAEGDITNPYVGGWNIYKVQGITGTTVFPDPEGGVGTNVWEELTATTRVATLSIEATQWQDPEFLETGICASYAIAPIDREGLPNYDMINVTRVNGVAELLCGDALAPTTTVEQFRHTWQFTNDTACFDLRKDWSSCYEVTLNWVWPAHEPQGNVSWNLYRVEFAPDNVDLRFIDPIAFDLAGVPGEQGTFSQAGLDNDGIRPYRTYYYILAPIDSVGNELMIADYPSPNIERVHIDDDWWAYNQHIIPPEPEPPEPPLGIPWLQKLNDATQVTEFQLAGAALLATILLNFILLPLILKKRKRLKRVVEARKRNAAATNEFDDFFE